MTWKLWLALFLCLPVAMLGGALVSLTVGWNPYYGMEIGGFALVLFATYRSARRASR